MLPSLLFPFSIVLFRVVYGLVTKKSTIPDQTFNFDEFVSIEIPFDTFESDKLFDLEVRSKPSWLIEEFELIEVGKSTDIDLWAIDLVFEGDLVYVSVLSVGIKIFDVSDKSNPTTNATLLLDSISGSFIQDDYLYVAAWLDGLKIFDLSTSPPVYANELFGGGYANGIFVEGDYAYTAADGVGIGFRIFNVNDVQSLSVTDYYSTSDGRTVVISGNLAYFVDNTDGFIVFDVTEKDDIQHISTTAISGACGVVVLDGLAYVASGSGGFTIFNVETPETPQPIKTFDTDIGIAYSIFVDSGGKYLYIADRFYGVKIYDVSNPSDPILFRHFDNGYEVFDVKPDGNFVYVGMSYHFMVLSPHGLTLSGNCSSELSSVSIRASDEDNYVEEIFLIECTCSENFFGEHCNVTMCFGQMSNTSAVCGTFGECVDLDECICFDPEFYFGEQCNVTTCFNLLSNTSESCGTHGECVDHNICSCSKYTDYYGEFCNITMCYGHFSNTSEACGTHGECVGPQRCTCFEPELYFGEECDVMMCFGIYSNISEACGIHGECIDYQTCSCDTGYYFHGDEENKICNITECGGIFSNTSESCGTHGSCYAFEKCLCEPNYFGEQCDVTICFGVLQNMTESCSYYGGSCIGFQNCSCETDYFGEQCNVTICFGFYSNESGVCNERGVCDYLNHCVCSIYPSYTGDNCSILYDPEPQSDNGEDDLIGLYISLGVVFFCIFFTPAFLLLVLCLFVCFGVLVCCILGCICVCCVGSGGVLMVSSKSGLVKKRSSDNYDAFDKILIDQDRRESVNDTSAQIKINKELFEIEYSKLKVTRVIGKGGSSSTVFLCKWKGKDVGFKCFQTSMLMSSEHTYQEFEKEVQIMGSIRHPFILVFYGCCLHPPRVGIVMEYCSMGDLSVYLSLNKDTPLMTKIRILAQVSDAMDYLHERKIIHRDLKSENILLSESLEPKVMDFGLSKICQRISMKKTQKIGTSFYMAPEVVLGESYTTSCDVFSFGIVIWEVLTNCFEPFGSLEFNVEYKIANDENYRPNILKIPKEVGSSYPQVIEVMKTAWKGKSSERPTFEEIKEKLTTLLGVQTGACGVSMVGEDGEKN